VSPTHPNPPPPPVGDSTALDWGTSETRNEAWLEIRAEAFRAQRLDWAGIGLVLGFLLGALFVTLIGGGQ